jgi:hypothetical protein
VSRVSKDDGLPNKRRRSRKRLPAIVDDSIPEPDENGNWPEVAEDGSVYPYNEIYHELYSRSVGGVRAYTVNLQKNDASAPSTKFIVKSSEYPNGNDGDQLILANGDTNRYLIKSTGCGTFDYQLDANAAKTDASGKWVSEHIVELQAFPRFLEAALSGKYKKPTQLPGQPTEDVTKSDLSMVYPNIIKTDFAGWTGSQSPATLSMSWIGSVDHSDNMVVYESVLNAMNSRISFYPPPP